MGNIRSLRESGEKLILGGCTYTIKAVEGCGGNSIVYQAIYNDNLNKELQHEVLIKELYPYYPQGGIYRDETGNISYVSEAEEYMQHCKMRFKQGNEINLRLLQTLPSQISGNVNSYEAYGTYYSVLTVHGGRNLEHLLETTDSLSLRDAAKIMEKVLDAVEIFHENEMLHLDISPDNIILLPEQAFLIDYNSAWSMSDRHNGGFSFSEKEGYSAPEIRLCDAEKISYATDVYSVCAVFYRILTGKKLTDNEIIRNGLKSSLRANLSIFQGEPNSAVLKAAQIVIKGLQMIPEKRYQSVTALRREFDELLLRIEGKGVSYSAIWESSRNIYRKTVHCDIPYILQDIRNPQIMELMSGNEMYSALKDRDKILLKGSGGMGKTRFLEELWRNNVRQYRETEPVVWFVPLKEYQYTTDKAAFIRKHLLKHLCFSPESMGTGEALHELEQFFDKKRRGNVNIIFLLDGLNEAGTDREKLLKEIEELSEKEGVSVLITERSDEVLKYGLQGFKSTELLPLDQEKIQKETERMEIPYPTDSRMQNLLGNPMMLELYTKVCSFRKESQELQKEIKDISTPEKLIQLYVEQVLNYQLRIYSGRPGMQLCSKYIINHMLPDIAGEMKKKNKTLLSVGELYKIAQKNYSNLYKTEFCKTFPEYLGKSRLMLEKIADASEWFDFAVEEHLTGELGLLVKTGGGYYGLVHDNFIGYLTEASEHNRTVYRKRQRRGVFLKGTAVSGAFLILCFSVICILHKTGVFSDDREPSEQEQQIMKRATACMQMNLGIFSGFVSDQRSVLEMEDIEDVLNRKPLSVQEMENRIDIALSKDLDNYSELKTEVRDGLIEISDFPITEYEDLCDAPVNMAGFMEPALMDLKEKMCSSDSIYSKYEDRKALIDVYEEYLDAYTEFVFYELDYVSCFLFPEQAAEILDANQYSKVFRDYFKTVQIGNQDTESIRRGMESAGKKLRAAKNGMLSWNYNI